MARTKFLCISILFILSLVTSGLAAHRTERDGLIIEVIPLGDSDRRIPLEDLAPHIERLQHPDPTVRWKAAIEIGEIGPRAELAVPALAKALEDPDASVRWMAAKALGQMQHAAGPAAPSLAEALEDLNVDFRLRAAVTLGQIGPAAEAAVPALINALKDSHLQKEAAKSLLQNAGGVGKRRNSFLDTAAY